MCRTEDEVITEVFLDSNNFANLCNNGTKNSSFTSIIMPTLLRPNDDVEYFTLDIASACVPSPDNIYTVGFGTDIITITDLSLNNPSPIKVVNIQPGYADSINSIISILRVSFELAGFDAGIIKIDKAPQYGNKIGLSSNLPYKIEFGSDRLVKYFGAESIVMTSIETLTTGKYIIVFPYAPLALQKTHVYLCLNEQLNTQYAAISIQKSKTIVENGVNKTVYENTYDFFRYFYLFTVPAGSNKFTEFGGAVLSSVENKLRKNINIDKLNIQWYDDKFQLIDFSSRQWALKLKFIRYYKNEIDSELTIANTNKRARFI